MQSLVMLICSSYRFHLLCVSKHGILFYLFWAGSALGIAPQAKTRRGKQKGRWSKLSGGLWRTMGPTAVFAAAGSHGSVLRDSSRTCVKRSRARRTAPQERSAESSESTTRQSTGSSVRIDHIHIYMYKHIWQNVNGNWRIHYFFWCDASCICVYIYICTVIYV